MSLPSAYTSGIRAHYSRQWEDNYTLKLHLFFKVICSKGCFQSGLTVAKNIEEFVSFLSATYCVCVYHLNTDLLWIYKALNDSTCYSYGSMAKRGIFIAILMGKKDVKRGFSGQLLNYVVYY